MTTTEMVDELTHLKTQFVTGIDNLIKKASSIKNGSSDSTTSSIMTKLLLERRAKKPNYTPKEKELKSWFDRPQATANEPKSSSRFWGRFPTVKDALENPMNDDFQFLTQLNKAFYGIAWHILKEGRKNNRTTEEIVDMAIWEANIFVECMCLETFRGMDDKLELNFIKNVKRVTSMIENGTMR